MSTTKRKTSFAAPSGKKDAANAFEGMGGGKGRSPFELLYRGKTFSVGDSWELRILSLDPEYVVKAKARQCHIINPNNGSMMDGIVIPDPGHPHNAKLVDHSGTPFTELKEIELNRIPVFVYRRYKADGSVEEVNALRYLEFTTGLRIALIDMQQAFKGQAAFDPETKRPEYDVLLKIVYNNKKIPKRYEFEPVFVDDNGNRHPHRNMLAEDVLEDLGFYAQIEDEWETLMDDMQKGLSLEDIEARLRQGNGGGADDDDEDNEPVSARRSAPTVKTPRDEDDEEVEETPRTRQSTSSSAGRSAFGSRRRG